MAARDSEDDGRNEARERGFTVVDRRHGREDDDAAGERAEREAWERRRAREGEPAAAGAGPRAAGTPPGAERPAGAAGPGREPASGGAGPMPAMDFSTFVVSLSTSCLLHLGLVGEEEGAPPPPPNLPMAKQTIDILELLEAKTRGNLEPDEERLLGSLLYELRMRFVEVQRSGGG